MSANYHATTCTVQKVYMYPWVLIFSILLYALYYHFLGNLGCLTWVKVQQLQEQHYPVLHVHAGSFRVSVILETGSLTCVCDYSYACVYTWGLGTPTTSQHNIFDWKTSHNFFIVLLTGFLYMNENGESTGEYTLTVMLPSTQCHHLKVSYVSRFCKNVPGL